MIRAIAMDYKNDKMDIQFIVSKKLRFISHSYYF